MMYRDSDTRTPMSPQLALRVAIIGGVALIMFGVVFFRLWYLPGLSGHHSPAPANPNPRRDIVRQAPRGRIVDRNGRILVDNRSGYAVVVNPAKLPKAPQQRRQTLPAPARGPGGRARRAQEAAHPRRRAPVQGGPVLERRRQGRRPRAGLLLHPRARRGLPRRERGAAVLPPLPARRDRRAHVRDRRPGHLRAAQAEALPR